MLLPHDTPPPEAVAGALFPFDGPFDEELCCAGGGDCPPLTSKVCADICPVTAAAKRGTMAKIPKFFFTGLLCKQSLSSETLATAVPSCRSKTGQKSTVPSSCRFERCSHRESRYSHSAAPFPP